MYEYFNEMLVTLIYQKKTFKNYIDRILKIVKILVGHLHYNYD